MKNSVQKKTKKDIRFIDTFKHFLLGLLFTAIALCLFFVVQTNFSDDRNFVSWLLGTGSSIFFMYYGIQFFIFFYLADRLRKSLNSNAKKGGNHNG